MTSRLAAVTLTVILFVVTALAVAARAALPPDRAAFWRSVARCETGSRWDARGPTYEGGLGFYVQTWRWWARELGLLGRYPHAYLAPPLVQMRVAEFGLRVHRGYWGCLH